MPEINNLASQVRQNIAEQQKFRNELENNDNQLNNSVSGTLTSQINQLENTKSKQGDVVLDLGKDLEKATDDVEREKISGKLNDAKDFMKDLDDDIEKLNNKNKSAQSLNTSIKNGTAIQNNFTNNMKSSAKDETDNDKTKNVVNQQDKATIDEMSSELKKSQGVLNKIVNGGK